MGVHQVIMAPVMEHSVKPDEVHARIERLLAGPYLELFARAERPGWTTWGNEIPPPQIADDEDDEPAFDGTFQWDDDAVLYYRLPGPDGSLRRVEMEPCGTA
jgi:hypothetical protein